VLSISNFGIGDWHGSYNGTVKLYAEGFPMSKFVSFFNDESGASAAEYALILAIVGVGIVVAAAALRDSISGAMNSAASTISAN